MAKANREIAVDSLLKRVEAVMREGVSAMSEEEFAAYERDRKEIAERIEAKAATCVESGETHAQATRVLHA
jgi:Skp family chaperone for outer membrane proteins